MIEQNFKFAAVIPFYNEAGKIDKVIKKTIKFVDLVICVDDGSTDNYLNNSFNLQNIILLHHNTNLGKGKALKTGIDEAKKKNIDFVICLDGDLQHDPSFIPYFIKECTKYDLVIGKRNLRAKNMPVARRLSNFFSSKILSILTGQNILDSQSGYRLINTKLFDNIVIKSYGFEAETELLLKVAFNKLSIGFIPITTLYSDKDDSKIRNIDSIFGFIKIIIACLYERNKKNTNY
ncbi:MAG TPA: glycosyltransferase family 2 protein [Melioribacteraceae bacterium]|nr:glycosyltransferase family 2 protein [Melioribacteraceae bacterium]